MLPRTQPPVHSPLTVRALLAGAASTLAPGRFDVRIEGVARRTWAPRALLWTDSGTSALRLALEGLGESRPGPVALPGYSCYDIATAAVGAGAAVLLYDLDPRTLSPDPTSLERTLEEGATAVVVAHLYGIPVDMEAVGTLARRHGAVVVEDAAQGAGGSWRRRPLGAVGSLGVLSFGRGKGVTGGRGGLLLANDPVGEETVAAVAGRLGRRRPGLASLAAAGTQWLLGRPAVYAGPRSVPWLGLGETVYRPPASPRPLPRSAAGILAHTLRSAETAARIRRAHARRLLPLVEATEGVTAIRPAAAGAPGHLRLPVLVADDARLPGSGEVARLGVARGYPLPLARLPELREAIRGGERPCPGADLLARHLVTLPTHGLLRAVDLHRLERWLIGAGNPGGNLAPRSGMSAPRG